jgi:hypothetical protein
MNQMTAAAKVAKLREMAKDKSLPQDVRNQYLDEAVKLEEKAAKGAGVKLAKGGMPMVEKAGVKVPAFAADGVGKMAKGGAVKKMMYGGMADKPMMAKGGDAKKKMMMGGAVVAKAPAKDLPMRGQRTATNMAKGGAVKAKKGGK